MKVLILVPGDNARGGITNYYASLRKHLPNEIIYFKRGSRNWPNKSNPFIEGLRILSDYIRFIHIILVKKISIVQTTTAFYRGSIIRDGLFIIIARIFGKRTIVFFRGWNDKYAYGLSGIYLWLFKLVYFHTNAIIDLSENNVNYIKELGYKNKIYLETTVVDRCLLEDVDVEQLIEKRFNTKIKTILFLSRIEKAKGIYKLLDIYKEIIKDKDNYQLVYAGDGTELQTIKNKVNKEQVPNVSFRGFVEGSEKKELFKEASVFVFLSEFEGMPNAVLEAMAFGLPVITTNVGGIASVFQNEKNGFLLEEYSKSVIVNQVEMINTDKEMYEKICFNNIKDSQEKVISDVVARRMIEIFQKTSRTE